MLLLSSTDIAFQSGLFPKDETSSFNAASPPHLLLKISQVRVAPVTPYRHESYLVTSSKELVNT